MIAKLTGVIDMIGQNHAVIDVHGVGYLVHASAKTLGRIGGDGLALTGWVLGIVALLVSLTAALAVGVYAVLTFTQG